MYERGIHELADIKYRILHLLPFSSLLSISTLLIYFAFRLKCLITAHDDSWNVLNSTLYFIAEWGLLFPGFLNHALRCLAFYGRKRARHLRYSGDNGLPRVDVFITCAGEDDDMVSNTAEAACAIDYPSSLFRVIVLDDAASDRLGMEIRKRKETNQNLLYTARDKGKDHHFKAGNLNHGLSYTDSLPGGGAEFIGALDADMIPHPQWLRALLPHMLRNLKLALAQPPQRFYDVPTEDPLMQGLDVNFKITEALKETTGSTWCGGSGYLLRRAAMDDIGGFPTESVGEDMYCSNVLLGKGWDAIYVDETLQSGRVPESYKAHVKQQGRWHVGRIQTAMAMCFYLYGDKARRMGLRQRATGLIYVILSLCNILTTVGMGTLLIAISSTKSLILYSNDRELRILVQLVCACVIAEWFDDCVVALITGYRIAISEGHMNFWIAPYHAGTIVRAFSPAWLQRERFQFTPSGSSSEPKRKALPSHNAAGLRRAWHTLRAENVGFHFVYILLCSAGLAHSFNAFIKRPHEDYRSLSMDFVLRMAWPPVLWLVCMNSFTIPIRCAFRPPSIPNRSQLLKKDPVRRALYPDEVKDPGEDQTLGSHTLCYSLIMFYVIGLFIYSFYAL